MSDELGDLLKRIEILSNEKYEANLALRLQKDLTTMAQALAASRLEMLRRLYDISVGLLTIDDEDPDGLWLERMLEAKKVMNDVQEELDDK